MFCLFRSQFKPEMAEWMDVLDDETGVWERAVVQKNGGKFFVTRWERYPAYGGEEVCKGTSFLPFKVLPLKTFRGST